MPAKGAIPATPPLIIGATGGSGTRVVARIARHAGYDLGSRLNRADDAVVFQPFHEEWINRFLALHDAKARQEMPLPERLLENFRTALRDHCGSLAPVAGDPPSRWGWKAPRTIYLLPFLHAQFPGMKFIQVLRDGRDMAFSKNQTQLAKYGSIFLDWRERWLAPRPVRAILLWDRVNRRAAEYGAAKLGANYHHVRFEDLCAAPEETVRRILAFLDCSADPEPIARQEIAPPGTLGRWRAQPPAMVARLEGAGAASLRAFGYLPQA